LPYRERFSGLRVWGQIEKDNKVGVVIWNVCYAKKEHRKAKEAT
jgi:hypothetical protein